MKKKLLSILFALVLAVSLMIVPAAVSAAEEEADLLEGSFVCERAEGEGACTAFYMGKATTENGSYIWGRSEDISASYTKLFQVHEAEDHALGDMYVSGDWDASFTTFTPMFTWPYPERTLRYILCSDSIYNERQDPEPYAEVGMNEKGVCLSSTVSLSRCKSQISALDPRVSRTNGGLAETDVASVVLMQAETAREACELVAKIIDTVGASGREGLMVSDPNEVWFFQWLSGHQYIAVKCPDDMIGFSPNITGNVGDAEGWTDLTDTENVIASPGLVSVAKQAGVLVSKDDDTKIKIADTYSSRTANYRKGRMRTGYGYLYGYTTNEQIAANLPDVKYLDFFQEPRQDSKYSLYEAMRLLACRGEGTEWEASSSIGNDRTIEAHVFEVRPDMPFDLAQIEWISLAPPEFGVYLPYYGNLVTEVFEKCYSPDPNPRVYDNNDPDNNSMYWVFRELHTQCAARDLPVRERFGNGVRAFWERYQKSLIEQQAYVDDAMTKILAKEGLEAVEAVATSISMQLAEQTYDYAKQILAELKAFKEAGTAGAFVPSVLDDEDAIPNYVDLIFYVDLILLVDDDFTSATPGWGVTHFGTIQDGIDGASPGFTIIVAAGTYTEDLVIPATKTDLELVGAGGATIKGVAMVDSTLWPAHDPNIEILADGVSIHGCFTIQGPDPVPGYYSSGMIIGGADVEIYDNAFEVGNASHTDDVGQAIVAYNQIAIPGVDVSGLSIHNNTFTSHGAGTTGYEGIYINRDAGTGDITIADNTFTGDMIRGITVERSNATISGNRLTATGGEAWTGVLVMDVGGGERQDSVSVVGNTIKGFGNGIKVGPGDQSQVLTNISITNNTIQGNSTGVLVRSSADGVVINYNDISGNPGAGTGVQNDDTANILNAEKNWWGDVAGPKTDSDGTLHNPYELWTEGDAVSDYVDYLPWLIRTDLVVDFGGWNIVSFPIMGEEPAEPSPPPKEIVAAYWFDSSTQYWNFDPYQAGALDAMYMKVTAPISFIYPVSSEVFMPSQKAMKVGWNLIGLAELHEMSASEALLDAYYGTGEASLVGYTKVISPSLNGESWTHLRTVMMKGRSPDMFPLKGYWVFMVNNGKLGGFTNTPIAEGEFPLPRPPR